MEDPMSKTPLMLLALVAMLASTGSAEAKPVAVRVGVSTGNCHVEVSPRGASVVCGRPAPPPRHHQRPAKSGRDLPGASHCANGLPAKAWGTSPEHYPICGSATVDQHMNGVDQVYTAHRLGIH